MNPGKPKVPPIMLAVMGSLLCGSFALLIWAKLRMVTGTPRTAYADPKRADREAAQDAPPIEHVPIRAPNRPADPQASVEKSQQQTLDSAPVEDSGSGGF